jgi:hypothetical protein
MVDILEGGCLCGGLRFAVEGETSWCAHCHCRMCQKAHGAGYVTWVGVADQRFSISLGASNLKWFASSPGAQRGFCGKCGSSMFFRSNRWPGETHITLANFDGPIDRQPQGHVYYASHVEWMPVDESLPIRPD